MGPGLPLDAHLHTDLSADSNVPIDVYAGLAREQGVAELAITDHLDFDPRFPNHRLADHSRRERIVREAGERWAGAPLIRFGVEITYQAARQEEIAAYLATHAYDYTIGSVHIGPYDALGPASAARWCAGRSHREASEHYWQEVGSAIESGLFDTIGHLDFVKRYLVEHLGPFEYEAHADIYEGLLVAIVRQGMALEVNSSGLRQSPKDTYPPATAVERFRQIGGGRVVAGSDAHRAESFASGLERAYRIIEAAGFRSLAFRRGGGPVDVPLSEELVAAITAATVGGHDG